MSENQENNIVTVELLQKYDRPGPRYTSYPTAPVWSDKVTAGTYQKALKKASEKKETPFAIYCHIPFCHTRCYYCGCNTCITKEQDKVTRYLGYMDNELTNVSKLLGERRRVNQFHFGGGTPTYIGIEGLQKIVQRFGSVFELTKDCEISIEVDPRTTSSDDIRKLREIGFNRISFGVQDFDPEVQNEIGRKQSIECVQGLLTTAREVNYKGINFDLIYGLPSQTPDSFDRTLDICIAMRPDRVALYSFAYLPKLRPNQRKIKADKLPDTETKYRLFSDAVKKFTKAGYLQIGMDHFALPEDELAQAQNNGRLHRNFMGYTIQSAPDMIGFGMSSIGYINDTFIQNSSQLETYEELMDNNGFAVYRGLELSQDDLIRQYVISNLMCNFNVSFDDLTYKFGVKYEEYFAEDDSLLAPFIEDGFLIQTNEGMRVTKLGRTFVRNIAMTFDAYLKDPDQKTIFSRTI